MDELAGMCGLNKAMVFYYFKNKKGLYEAVIQEVLEKLKETIVEENKIHKTAEQELEGFIRTYAQFAYEHKALPSLLLKELSDSGAVIPDMLFVAMRQLFALFSDILKRGEQEGYFHDAVPMILYFMVIGTLNLLISSTEPLRVRASELEDIDIDTCSECDIDEIANYIIEKIKQSLRIKNAKTNT